MDRRTPLGRETEERGEAVPSTVERVTQMEIALSRGRIEQLAREATQRTDPFSMANLHMESSHRGHLGTDSRDVSISSRGIYHPSVYQSFVAAGRPLSQADIQDPCTTTLQQAPGLLHSGLQYPPYSQHPQAVHSQYLSGLTSAIQPIQAQLDQYQLSRMLQAPLGYPTPVFTAQLPPGSRIISVAKVPSSGTVNSEVASLTQPSDTSLDKSPVAPAPLDLSSTSPRATLASHVASAARGSAASAANASAPHTLPNESEQEKHDKGSAPRNRKKRKYEHESFPEKLHRLIVEAAVSGKAHIVRYTSNGKRFEILQTKSFENEILPHYFRHNRISSFKRLLRMYGFKRVEGKSPSRNLSCKHLRSHHLLESNLFLSVVLPLTSFALSFLLLPYRRNLDAGYI